MAIPNRVVLAVSGASGIQYAQCLLQTLIQSKVETHIVFSDAALEVWKAELDIPLKGDKPDLAAFAGVEPDGVKLYRNSQVGAAIASGSFRHRGMVVCPCSMSTLGAIATGAGDKLIGRAAEVTLKERRKLILVPRETPYSLIALRNMVTLTEAGAVILDANPGFYARPKTVDDIVRFVVARVLDHLEIDHKLSKRWGEKA